MEAVHKYDEPLPVVIDCSRFRLFDATFLDTLTAIAKELRSRTTTTPQGNLLILQSLPANQEQRQQLLATSVNLRFSQNNFPIETDTDVSSWK